jgi:iron complex outermembrane receptor protein
MMTSFSRFFVIILFAARVSAATISGTVSAAAGPLPDALVALDSMSARTDAEGRFRFDVLEGRYRLRVSHEGFQPQLVDADTSREVSVTLKPAMAESIVVSGIRAERETPVTKSDLGHADIEKNYFGQDIPLLLRETPSINAYAEGGVGGAGYSYISLRGISPTRLNFTLDGVPLADPEDMGTYFVDFPDLAHSLESIQVQRGVGTSTFGSPSFGGSVNLESLAPSQERSTNVWLGAGSFGTKLGSVAYQTGAMPGGLAAYGRLSYQETDGFRAHSGLQQHNVFFSGAKQADDWQLKITGFAGHEKQQLSFYATDEDTLKGDLRNNPLSPDDRDSFGYNLAEVQYLRANTTAAVYFQRGYGWYTLDGYRYGIDGLLLGGFVTRSASWRGVSAQYGVHVNRFRRDHALDFADTRAYRNYGTKGEANGFAKFNYDVNRWRLYGDLQLRTTNFDYHGDVAIHPIRWTFLNPKVGARYDLSANSGVYASLGISRREPTRNDLFQGEDNATVPHDLHAVRPERLLDIEAGWDYRTARGSLAANVYAMEFRNEIAATGELSDIGLALRRNVDRSYRRGIEIEHSWQFVPSLRLRGNASFSRNRIGRWTQFYGDRAITYSNVNPVLSPATIINESLDYAASSRVLLTATARHVSEAHLDNTNDDRFTTPAFTALDGSAAWSLSRAMRLTLQVNNLLNSKRIFPSGYSYLFLTPGGAVDGIRYFYPQATRNFVLALDARL